MAVCEGLFDDLEQPVGFCRYEPPNWIGPSDWIIRIPGHEAPIFVPRYSVGGEKSDGTCNVIIMKYGAKKGFKPLYINERERPCPVFR